MVGEVWLKKGGPGGRLGRCSASSYKESLSLSALQIQNANFSVM